MAKGWLEVRSVLAEQLDGQALISRQPLKSRCAGAAGVQIQLLCGYTNLYDRSLCDQSRQIGCNHQERRSLLTLGLLLVGKHISVTKQCLDSAA